MLPYPRIFHARLRFPSTGADLRPRISSVIRFGRLPSRLGGPGALRPGMVYDKELSWEGKDLEYRTGRDIVERWLGAVDFE